MKRDRTYRGKDHRCQLTILTTKSDGVFFLVHVLSNEYPDSTPFRSRAGNQMYFGRDFEAAWREVTFYCPNAVRPTDVPAKAS